jgi:hypothetical protein
MPETTPTPPIVQPSSEKGFVRAIGLFDGTMIVVGSMIGSGIFIVAADITRQTGSAGGLLLTWILTGSAHGFSSPLLWGTGGHVPPRRWAIYLFARGLFAPVGIFVRLDALSGDSDRHDCRRSHWLCAIFRRLAAGHLPARLGLSPRSPSARNTPSAFPCSSLSAS